jgi:hypothetical protein
VNIKKGKNFFLQSTLVTMPLIGSEKNLCYGESAIIMKDSNYGFCRDRAKLATKNGIVSCDDSLLCHL